MISSRLVTARLSYLAKLPLESNEGRTSEGRRSEPLVEVEMSDTSDIADATDAPSASSSLTMESSAAMAASRPSPTSLPRASGASWGGGSMTPISSGRGARGTRGLSKALPGEEGGC